MEPDLGRFAVASRRRNIACHRPLLTRLAHSDPKQRLDHTLAQLARQDGVVQVVLLGRDGLVVHRVGGSSEDAEALAAALPSVATAGSSVGDALQRGDIRTVVLELEACVVIIQPIVGDLFLAVLVRRGVGFAPLLSELRPHRQHIADLL